MSQPSALGTGDQKIALVIGNGAYKDGRLINPPNDARAIAATLRDLGFNVMEYIDANQEQMETSIREFGDRLRMGGVALFYYAGHGIQVGGSNYLIPIGAIIERETEVKYKSVDAGFVLAQMEDAKNSVNIVILDACRSNPFARRWRSSTKGLATVDAPTGTIVSFATAPGKEASDGDAGNGLYTERLLYYMKQPGLTIEDIFKYVRRDVQLKSRNQQTPWELSSLTGNFYFIPGTSEQVEPAPAVQQPAPAVQQPAPTPAPATQKPAAVPAVQKPAPAPEKKVEPAPAPVPAAKKMVITAGVLGGLNYWMWSGSKGALKGNIMGFGGGAFVKVSGLIPFISPRVEVQYGMLDGKENSTAALLVKVNGITANLNLIYDIKTTGKIAPYVGIGGGVSMVNETLPAYGNTEKAVNRMAINVVAGAAFQINPTLSVGLDLGFVYDLDGENNYVPIYITVGYAF
jgi:hypothetical protein